MKKILVILVFLCSGFNLFSRESMQLMPFFQQCGIYYLSDKLTSAGYGTGIGLNAGLGENWLAQIDMNLYWINGNTVTTRLSVGYELPGSWSPAVYANYTLLWGSRTEVLTSDGTRPVTPVSAFGLRIAPLRFGNERAIGSALELGYSFGLYSGQCFELTLLQFGFYL